MLIDKALISIQKFQMIKRRDRVLVAVSGGCDSVVLLDLLNGLKKRLGLRLGVVHVNHGLRGRESDREEQFVKALAKKYRVPFYGFRANVKQAMNAGKISLEEAAREIRYGFFEKQARETGARKIAVAHNRDDQAETVLMRLITGTGLQGLQAIRPKRKIGRAWLVRPLIEISRAEIRAYARAKKIRFREDSSNRSTKFLRNQIRLRLIPYLEKKFNPRVKHALARLPHLLDADSGFLEEAADVFYRRLAEKTHKGEIRFSEREFLKLKPAMRYRLLGRAMRALGGVEPDYEHWNAFCEKLSGGRQFCLQMPRRIQVSVRSGAVCVSRQGQKRARFQYFLGRGKAVEIPEAGKTISCGMVKKKPGRLHKSDNSYECFDAEKLSFPLVIRGREPGDRFQTLGMSKPLKLKKFLINRRIDAGDRDRIPLVVSGGNIIWVAGVAMAETAKVTPGTKSVVRISIC